MPHPPLSIKKGIASPSFIDLKGIASTSVIDLKGITPPSSVDFQGIASPAFIDVKGFIVSVTARKSRSGKTFFSVFRKILYSKIPRSSLLAQVCAEDARVHARVDCVQGQQGCAGGRRGGGPSTRGRGPRRRSALPTGLVTLQGIALLLFYYFYYNKGFLPFPSSVTRDSSASLLISQGIPLLPF